MKTLSQFLTKSSFNDIIAKKITSAMSMDPYEWIFVLMDDDSTVRKAASEAGVEMKRSAIDDEFKKFYPGGVQKFYQDQRKKMNVAWKASLTKEDKQLLQVIGKISHRQPDFVNFLDGVKVVKDSSKLAKPFVTLLPNSFEAAIKLTKDNSAPVVLTTVAQSIDRMKSLAKKISS